MAKTEQNVSREIKEMMDCGILLNRVPKLIERMFKSNLNLFLWGDPGIGKTQSVEQFVEKMQEKNKDFEYYYFPLASMEPSDLMGIPMPEKADLYGKQITRTTWAIPKNLPMNPDGEGLLYFDEFNNAPAAMQNAVQQLVQERRIGDYRLPKGYRIIAAGNQTGVNAYSTEIQAPVKDRFGHVYVKTNADVWFDYMLGLDTTPKQGQPFLPGATKDKILQTTLGFVKQSHPDKLFDTDNYNNNSYMFATPRSWARFIKLYSDNLDADKDEVFTFASMYVGPSLANLLLEYLKNSERYQNPDEILKDNKGFRDDGDLNGFFGTFTGVLAKLNQLPEAPKNEKGRPDKESKEYKELAGGIHALMTATAKLSKRDWQAIVTKNLTKVTKFIDYLSSEDLSVIAANCTSAMKNVQ